MHWYLREVNGFDRGDVIGFPGGPNDQDTLPGIRLTESWAQLLGLIAQGLSGRYDYQLSVFESDREDAQGRRVYCVVHVPNIGDEHLIGAVRRDVVRMRRRLASRHGLDIRLLLSRVDDGGLPSAFDTAGAAGRRSDGGDRRQLRSTLIYAIERGRHSVRSDHGGFELSLPPPCR